VSWHLRNSDPNLSHESQPWRSHIISHLLFLFGDYLEYFEIPMHKRYSKKVSAIATFSSQWDGELTLENFHKTDQGQRGKLARLSLCMVDWVKTRLLRNSTLGIAKYRYAFVCGVCCRGLCVVYLYVYMYVCKYIHIEYMCKCTHACLRVLLPGSVRCVLLFVYIYMFVYIYAQIYSRLSVGFATGVCVLCIRMCI